MSPEPRYTPGDFVKVVKPEFPGSFRAGAVGIVHESRVWPVTRRDNGTVQNAAVVSYWVQYPDGSRGFRFEDELAAATPTQHARQEFRPLDDLIAERRAAEGRNRPAKPADAAPPPMPTRVGRRPKSARLQHSKEAGFDFA